MPFIALLPIYFIAMFRNAYNATIGQLLPTIKKREKQHTFNPKRTLITGTDVPTVYSVFQYNEQSLVTDAGTGLPGRFHPQPDSSLVTWIHVDGLRKEEVETLCANFSIHSLLAEDILSIGQRAKTDDMDTHLFALLPMLYYNSEHEIVETEQLSLVLGPNFLLSFQPDPRQDALDSIRNKLKNERSALRKKNADYLAYSFMDAVVDDYFSILELLSDRLEQLEDEVVQNPNNSVLLKISLLRHELMVVKRAIGPVREMVNTFRHSESPLISASNRKYFKDVYDHISLAVEYTENYREMAINLQDLYMNQVNTRMNEVMKLLTVVTTLLAPATVIGSIFGMNFVRIPFSQHPYGFVIAVLAMLALSIVMLLYFRKRRWF